MAEDEGRQNGVVVGQTRHGVVERLGPAGRRTLLTPVVVEGIVAAVRKGLPVVRAGALFELDEVTVLEWLQRGEGRHPTRPATALLAEFAERVKRAIAENQAEKLEIITRAAQGGIVLHERVTTYPDGREVREVTYSKPEWQAAMTYLERTDPDHFGRRERMDLRQMMADVTRRIAAEQGLKEEEVVAEAQRLVQDGR